MYLPQMLPQMVLPRETIPSRPVASHEPASVGANARMDLLVAIEFELSFVCTSAAVELTSELASGAKN
jgi:hypothetical protein